MSRKDVTIKELRYILENYEKLGPQKIADALGRSRVTVWKWANRHGLKYKGPSLGGFKQNNKLRERKAGDIYKSPKEGSGGCYYIKYEAGKPPMRLHKYNWEKAHGPVPEGYVLRFKDGDRSNCDISNLECISKKDNLRLNNPSAKGKE